MKKLFLIFFCSIFLTSYPKSTWLWSTDSGHSEAYGMVPYIDTVFNGSLTVYGMLKAVQSVFNGSVEVYGILLADRTRFEKKVIVYGNIELNYTIVGGNIEVFSDNQKPVIHARSTIIYGNVIFEPQGGVVYLYENAEVRGTVIGGRIVRI